MPAPSVWSICRYILPSIDILMYVLIYCLILHSHIPHRNLWVLYMQLFLHLFYAFFKFFIIFLHFFLTPLKYNKPYFILKAIYTFKLKLSYCNHQTSCTLLNFSCVFGSNEGKSMLPASAHTLGSTLLLWCHLVVGLMYWLVLVSIWEDGIALIRDRAVVIMIIVITFIYIAINNLAQGTKSSW